jgi:two-component system, OmpR family, KDP operon response regulator KdpE
LKQFRVLVVDDEPRIVAFLKVKLKASGYEVLSACNGLDALEQVQSQEPNLLVLDVVMPGLDGFETLKQVRSLSSIPVIMLSAKGDAIDRIKGLGLGADDYLPKPFSPDELVARIEAVKRRITSSERKTTSDELVLNNLVINFNKRKITLCGKELKLTKIEWLLLSEMANNPGKLMFYRDLLSRIWGIEYRDDVQILRTWVSRLRKKIESSSDSRRLITTVPKTGYIFNK